jgi:hypothetical protein
MTLLVIKAHQVAEITRQGTPNPLVWCVSFGILGFKLEKGIHS